MRVQPSSLQFSACCSLRHCFHAPTATPRPVARSTSSCSDDGACHVNYPLLLFCYSSAGVSELFFSRFIVHATCEARDV